MKEHQWKNEYEGMNRAPISKTEFRNLGLNKNSSNYVSNIEELRENPPNIVLATAVQDFKFIQNNFIEQSLKKNSSYVMSFSTYEQLHTFSRDQKIKFLKPCSIKFKNVFNPYKGEDLTDKTILVFRTGGIGDLLFIQPNLRYLKEKYPTCFIKFACGPQYQSMVETWECIDELLSLPFNYNDLKTSDYHVLFEGVIERCKEARVENAYNLFSKWMGLDLDDELLVPKQKPKELLVNETLEILKNWNIEPNSFIIMQLRASSPIRTPRPSFFKQIIDNLTDNNINVILTDSPSQSPNINEFIKLTKNPDKVFNFSSYSKSLDYTIALTSLCKMAIGTDSALSHISVSLDKKFFGIYGPFPGIIRLSTYKNIKWVDAKKPCAPCFIHSQKQCPKTVNGYSSCYDEIDIGKLNGEILEFLKEVIDD